MLTLLLEKGGGSSPKDTFSDASYSQIHIIAELMCYSGWTVYGYSILYFASEQMTSIPDQLSSCYVGYEHLTAL